MVWMRWEKMGLSKRKGGLGFRDLELFNLALLAKQGWRLLQHPESLMAQVMRAKYYPTTDFLSATLGPRPSYAWRSIFQSQRLLKEGLVWRVGNGESIKIWHDKWIPTPTSYMIQSPVNVLPTDACVSALIDEATHGWNVPLLKTIFWPTEVTAICSLVPCPMGLADHRVWKGTKNGIFSVRSAYHMEKERLMRRGGESSETIQQTQVWQKIWNLHVPATVKSFVWRVCHNSLPTRDNLYQKRVILDPLCPICGLYPETIEHVLWSCSAAESVWMECSNKIQKLSFVVTDGFGLVDSLFSLLESDELEQVLCLSRCLWLRRNSVVFGGNLLPPSQVFRQGREALEVFRNSVQGPDPPQTAPPRLDRNLWQKPEAGVVKTNWDAAIDLKGNRMGVGVIIRNEAGSVIAAMCAVIPFITDPTVAEAVALWRAVTLCGELTLQRIQFEGDAKEIVLAINNQGPCRCRYGHLIEASRNSLRGFPFWAVSYTRRDTNEAAHWLAKASLSMSLNFVWRDSYPDFIKNIVIAEQAFC
jgi:hypothetical protein